MTASAAALNAAAARAPSAASWTRPLRPAVPVAQAAGTATERAFEKRRVWARSSCRALFLEPLSISDRLRGGGVDHAGRPTRHRISQTRPAARTFPPQPVLAALPAFR